MMISSARQVLQRAPPLLDLYFYLAAAQLPLGLIRLLAIFDTARLILLTDLFFIALVPIIAWANGLKLSKLVRQALPVFLVFGFSAFIGLAFNHQASRVVLDAFRPISFFICFYSLKEAPVEWVKRQALSSHAARVFVVSAAGTLVLAFAARRLGYSFYLSITEIFFLLPLASLWLHKKRFAAASTFLLLLMGGRRGALLGGLVAMLPLALRLQLRPLIPRLILALGLLIGVGSIDTFRNAFLTLGTVEKTLDNLKYSSERAGDGGWTRIADRMFDDRIREVRAVTRELDRSWGTTIFGKGAGYSYFVESEYFDVSEPWTRGVHFSPIGVYAYYGLLGVLLVTIFFFNILRLSFRQYANGSDPAMLANAYFCVGFIFNTLTAFAVFISPCFAICAGILANDETIDNSSSR